MVIAAALTNALKLVGKRRETVKVVLSGTGAAGSASGRMLLDMGFSNLIFCDRQGILNRNDESLPPNQRELAQISNPEGLTGSLADALVGADIF
ncbi:MAG: NAD-dependent malic enzyme, partial [Firmicutes bacterium]|nr:NAD-dependent malic enzyme [Bacillota bacterium]